MSNYNFIRPTGKFEDWNVYKLSLIIVDITDLFVKTYLDKYRDRTVDQMVQAARSCKQNIVEGSMAAATSRETEIKLTNVAKASLGELREDYKDFIRHNYLHLWGKDDERTLQVRKFSKTHDKPEDYLSRMRERSAETFCNIAITLCHQLDYMLYCVIERAKAIFLEKGGIKEEMHRARLASRKNQSYQSYQSHQRIQDSSNNFDNSEISDPLRGIRGG
ncbi:MAG: four helix bundle suffix domain-containing protein [Muribaculaceae bacterium]|nr:four helix bundle suffix domain-containing protein [Muribaculaceae bacterium]